MGANKKETVEVIAEVPELVTKKKKKSKKNKEEEAEVEVEAPVVEETPAAEEGEKKKKKKKRSADEAEVETPVEAPTAEEEEPKKKKKKSKKADAEAEEEKKEEAEEEEEKEVEPEAKRAKTEDAEEATESTTVFIGGFPYSATEETIKKDFEECGEIVSFRFPKDYEGNAKGIAFAQFATKEGVTKALEYNETDYGGRTLRVRIAEDSPPGKGDKGKGKKGKKGDGKKGNREPGEKPADCKSVIVKNMSYETTEDQLWAHFEGIGTIERLKLLTDRETGASKGIAFIDFATTEDVDQCMKEKQNSDMSGRSIFIDYSGGKGEGKKGDGKKGDGKKGGKKGKGKGKKGGKKGGDPTFAARNGSIQESTGTTKSFDSDSD